MDNELLVGYDDSSIHPDNHQVLISYRGRPILAWNLDMPSREPQRCIRPEDQYGRHHDTWKAGTPECILWRPEMPIVLIVYNDTTLFEWNIEDDTQKEISEIRVQEMAISSDGNLLLTSDHTGTLRVWTVPQYRLSYQLTDDDMVRGLAFRPDDDLDREELSNTQDTTFSQTVSLATVARRAQITALVCDTEDIFYCCGKDSDAVVLYDMRSGGKIRKVYGHSTVVSVIEMAWSVSGQYIASADDCGRVIAKGYEANRPGKAISQLLFSTTEEYLLVSSSTCDWVWSLKISWSSLEEILETALNDIEESVHETAETDHLELPDISHISLRRTVLGESVLSVERAIQMHSTQIVCEVSSHLGSEDTYTSQQRMTLLNLNSPQAQGLQHELIKSLPGHANRLIGNFRGHIVFLDHQYCFYTWDSCRGASSLKRHFFLPKDWLSPRMLKLCIMNNFGTIMCPKNGEVAIIRSGMKL
ncbi:WD40-repeat-containing domain protein [Bisporella sp. PMI_857]|nr:WD40-repeat-containing domain protein [Bisporella sp. PMI_857]